MPVPRMVPEIVVANCLQMRFQTQMNTKYDYDGACPGWTLKYLNMHY